MAPQKVDLIMYHKDCPDGWCAAYIASKAYPEARRYGLSHGEQMNENFRARTKGANILMVDFSYPLTIMDTIRRRASSLTVYDHHKTAQAELAGFPNTVFDMERSGAAITYDELRDLLSPDGPVMPPSERLWFVDYVQDRDLWEWLLPDSKAINSYLMALPHTIQAWDRLLGLTPTIVAPYGEATRLHIDHYVEKVAAQARFGKLGKFVIGIVNAAYPNISDVLGYLCSEASICRIDIGLGWFERGDGLVQFSLRSVGDVDVSFLASLYGGGGHKNAAGFQIPTNEARQFLSEIKELS